MATENECPPPSYEDTATYDSRYRDSKPVKRSSTLSSVLNRQSTQYHLVDSDGTIGWHVRSTELFSSPTLDTSIAFIPVAGALIELILLAYLVGTYLSLPRDANDDLPRISNTYSIWPFISCVGGLRMHAFMGLTFSTIVLSVVIASILLYRTRFSRIGFWARRLNLASTLIYNSFGVWLVFASYNTDNHLHLFAMSAKSLAMSAARSCTLWVDKCTLEKHPFLAKYTPFRILVWWRRIEAMVAFPLAILLNLPVYTCMSPTLIQTPGTQCYFITAVGAPAEWYYNLLTVSWTLALAYDVWTKSWVTRRIEEVSRQEQEQAQEQAQEQEQAREKSSRRSSESKALLSRKEILHPESVQSNSVDCNNDDELFLPCPGQSRRGEESVDALLSGANAVQARNLV